MKTAEVFMVATVECPHCGDLATIDESYVDFDDGYECEECGEIFKPIS